MDYTLLDGNYLSYLNLTSGNRVQLDWEYTNCNFDREMRSEGYLVKIIDDLHCCILFLVHSQISGDMILFNLENRRIDKIFTVENDVITNEHFIHLKNTIYDISDRGERWEGGMDNEYCQGWGSLFDEYGHLEYEGFMFHGKKTGFGTEYFPDLGFPSYKGTFVNDQCIGFGTSYSRNETIIRQGAFPSIDFELVLTPDVFVICNQITSLVIEPELKIEKLNLNLFPSLCQFRCVEKSLPTIQTIAAVDHKCISQFTLQDKSCCSEYAVKTVCGSFEFKNCISLQSVEIGAYCLRKTRSFMISNCSSLSTLIFGEFSFNNAEEFILQGRRSKPIAF